MRDDQHARYRYVTRCALVAAYLVCCARPVLRAQEIDGWLRYAALDQRAIKSYKNLPSQVVILDDSAVLKSAQQELLLGFQRILGKALPVRSGMQFVHLSQPTIILGTLTELSNFSETLHLPKNLTADGYWLKSTRIHGIHCLVIASPTDQGVLYGAFALLRKIAQQQNVSSLDETSQPGAPLRWVDQWDNLDGRIERGYGGLSIFFSDGKVREDLSRAAQYARLLASIGINGCAINNVNADPRILNEASIHQVSRIADEFRPWGVRLALSVDLSSPKALGDLDTFDPLDPRVAEWWQK